MSKVAEGAEKTAQRERSQATDLGARIVTLLDRDYPPALLDLELPPPVLYAQGRLAAGPAIALVGSRHATRYGLQSVDWLAREIVSRGASVTSGFAQGIDARAHRSALEAGGHTTAVLGCGLDASYPRHRDSLGTPIAANGALVTEFPLGASPRRHFFPIRNRIIAALSSATVVVEAAARSGSLITARLALDLGREVFAVPGRVFDPRSQGTNELLRDGAHIVTSTDDLFEALPFAVQEQLGQPAAEDTPTLEGVPKRIVEHLREHGASDADQLAQAMDTSAAELLAELTNLELSGWVGRGAGLTFELTPGRGWGRSQRP